MSLLDMFRSKEKVEAARTERAAEEEHRKQEILNSDWHYLNVKNSMSGVEVLTGRLTSSNLNELDFPYNGGSSITITVTRNPRQVRLAIDHGQIMFAAEGGVVKPKFVTRLKARFDNGVISTLRAVQSASGSTNEMILENPAWFTLKLVNSSSLIIEPHLYQAEGNVWRFNSKGFSPALM